MTHIDLTPIADAAPQHVDRDTMPHGDAEPPKHGSLPGRGRRCAT
jgi:hypothetical protein